MPEDELLASVVAETTPLSNCRADANPGDQTYPQGLRLPQLWIGPGDCWKDRAAEDTVGRYGVTDDYAAYNALAFCSRVWSVWRVWPMRDISLSLRRKCSPRGK